jgi:hypothetical protein
MRKVSWTRILILASELAEEMIWEKDKHAIDSEGLEYIFSAKPPKEKKGKRTEESGGETKTVQRPRLKTSAQSPHLPEVCGGRDICH